MPKKAALRPVARAPLSKERVLAEAVRLADAEGLDALTMRRLASSLGVEAMSLYNHVANKDDILDGIVELVMAEVYVPEAGGDWKAAMRRRAVSLHEVLLQHPWASALNESRSNAGPARLRLCDAFLDVLRVAGFSMELAYHAFLTLDSYVYGFTLQELAWPYPREQLPEVIEVFAPKIAPLEYPRIVEMMTFVARQRATGAAAPGRKVKAPAGSAYHTEFEFGLDLILDGYERARDQR